LGTLEPRKNLGGVLGGFAHALALLDDAKAPGSVQLLLVGPQGWRQEGLREAIERAGVAGRVRWIGWQPRERLAALYAGAEAFLFPSLVEGFGLPVLEAMACGTPVVTSDVSSLPEVAGDAALFCDPLDPTSIGKTLANVVADRALAEDLAVRGRRRAAELTWDRTARETAAWYRRVLGIEGEEVRER
jgi:glycosyltransferase involved in cell wall biosynthesis